MASERKETAALVAQMRETGRVAMGVNMVVYTGSLGRVWIRDGRELVSVNREQRYQLAAILAWDQEEVKDE